MGRATTFDFSDMPSLSSEAFVVRIPAGLTTSQGLLQAFYKEARLPGYFGFNWDALSDCLRDLHWVDCHEVVLLHADLPKLPLHERRTYLDVLAECVASWSPSDDHLLTVVFPSAVRNQVMNLE